jgi:hypothetical protein
MLAGIDALIEFAVMAADVAENRNTARLQKQSRMPAALCSSGAVYSGTKAPRWTAEEDDFLRKNQPFMSDDELAVALGRSANAVHLRWERDMGMPARSKTGEWLTGREASSMLGLDEHAISHWCDVGLIPHRIMPGGSNIRLVRRVTLYRWAVNPENWIYFNWRAIPDDHLKRLCAHMAAKWGDEWWNTRQVADLHQVDPKDVLRLALRGELPAKQAQASLCGRHKDPFWLNWFVKRSDAFQVRFRKGRGAGHEIDFTERAEAWMLKAKNELGMTWREIARSMGKKCHPHTIRKRVRVLMGLE